jgi:hypothetical protein
MAWETNGNAGTNPATDFVGTTDLQPLSLRTNSNEAVHIDPAGNVGIGAANPQNLLHVGSGTSSISSSRVNAVIASNAPDAGIAIAQNSGVNVLLQASGAGAFIGTTSNHPVVFRTVDQDRVVIQSNGDVFMAGTLSVAKDVILTGADCAEHFDLVQDTVCEPGTVMAISTDGALDASAQAYDKRVAGVVSGAGSFRPGIVLDRQHSDEARPAVALFGKVYCKVDAEYAPIEVGDLLTTSDTVGHAMKACDPVRAFGAVVGKALGNLTDGRGLIPILVTLQ